MANDSKSKTAKERFEKAKKDAEDAELVPGADDISDAKQADDVNDAAGGEAPDADTLNSASDTISGGEGADSLIGDAGDDAPDAKADPIADVTTPDAPKDDLIMPADADMGADAGERAAEERAQDDAIQPADADEPIDAHHPEEAHSEDGSGFAATALKYLLILLVGMGVALWAAPRVAPHLPAPVAAWVAPAGPVSAEAERLIAEKTAEANEAAAAAQARADEAAAEVADLSARMNEALAALRTELSAEIGDAAQTRGAAADRVEDVAARITAAEAAISGVRAEIESLSGFTGDGEAPGAETLERVAAFGAAVEGLRSEVAALSERASEIEAAAQAADVEALEARVTALEGGEAATANARSEADEIVRRANIDAALTRISQLLAAGRAYEGPLADLTSLTGAATPEGLAASAGTGAPTLSSLTRRFPGAAQAAYAADLKANAGDGVLDSVFASVQGRVGGRPSVETPGDDAGAVLSRMEARLSEGALSAAQGEAQSLSEAARGAMAPWLARLDQTIAAQSGLSDLRAALNSK